MALWNPDALVELRLFPSDVGGRAGPISNPWWGCPLSIDGDHFDGRFDLSEMEPLRPGESRVAPLKFLNPDLVKTRITEGQQLRVWEGRFIGEAKVLNLYW